MNWAWHHNHANLCFFLITFIDAMTCLDSGFSFCRTLDVFCGVLRVFHAVQLQNITPVSLLWWFLMWDVCVFTDKQRNHLVLCGSVFAWELCLVKLTGNYINWSNVTHSGGNIITRSSRLNENWWNFCVILQNKNMRQDHKAEAKRDLKL